MNEEEASKYFQDWLWNSKKRKTDGMGWPRPHKADAINMLVDATRPKPQKKPSVVEYEKGLKLSPCKACEQPIHFVETKKGRLMPCNPKKLTVITVMGDVVSGWEAHFATCPQADKFRRGGGLQ